MVNAFPKDWKMCCLENKSSLIKDGSHGTHKDVSEGVPLLSAKDVHDGQLDIPSNCRKISEKDYNIIHNKYKIICNDILLTIVGTIGRCYLIKGTEPIFTIQRSVGVIRPFNIAPDYLHHFIRSVQFQNNLAEFTNASAQGGVYLGSLSKCEILYPLSEKEQKKIAELLTMVDSAISQTGNIIAKQERIKNGLMQDLFTKGIDEKGNIRSEKTHKFKDSPLGRIPKEWDAVRINDIVQLVGSGITPTGGSNIYLSEGILFIRSQNVYNEGLRLIDVAHISEEINSRMKRTCILPFDVLLNITGASIGRCCIVPEDLPRANVNQHVCIIRMANRVFHDAYYISKIIGSYIGQNQIKILNAGSNREGLNYQQVRNIIVPYAKSEKERKDIVKLLCASQADIQQSTNKLNKLNRIKTGLMNDLLTGKVRVNHLIEAVK